MDQDKLWAKFTKTGKVSDYLKYCGVDMGDAAVNSVAQEDTHETNDRRTDHSGKQQYR
jgi:hypothetical protein